MVEDRREAAVGKPGQVVRLEEEGAHHVPVFAESTNRLLHARPADLQRLHEDEVVGVGNDHGGFMAGQG